MKTLDDLETEAMMLGIHSISIMRKERTWRVTAFGDRQVSVGEGESMSDAYEDLILRYRLRAQKNL